MLSSHIQYETKKYADRIVLNISGELYETNIKTLERFPQTLLGNCEKRLSYYRPCFGGYYFDRSRLFFDAILFFYQSNGILQCPPELPLSLFEEECRFFEMPEDVISSLRAPLIFGEDEQMLEEDLQHIHRGDLRARIWNIMNNPETSHCSKVFTIFSVLMITISVVSICVESLPSLKHHSEHIFENPWHILDLALNIWFLLELCASIVCAPDRKAYLQRAMTWIDIVAVVPYFITLVVAEGDISSFGFVRIVRLTRVFRLFLSISKQSKMLQKLAIILKGCMEDFKTLFICLAMVIILGGSFAYFLEENTKGNMFTDIPTSVYWATVTITTVGYGDYHPVGVSGQIWATCYMLFGAVTLCIPIISVITKLEVMYEKETQQQKMDKYWSLENEEDADGT